MWENKFRRKIRHLIITYPGGSETPMIQPNKDPKTGSSEMAMVMARGEMYFTTKFNPVWPTKPGPKPKYKFGKRNSEK